MSPVHRNLNAPTSVRQARGRRLGVFRVLPLLVILLPLAAATAIAVEHLPDELPADEVESFVAPLSDSDARQLLIERLRRDALSREKVESAAFGDGRDVGERPNLFAASFDNITQWAPELPGALAQVMADAPAQAMLSQLGPSLRVMLVALAVAALVEWLLRRSFHQLQRHMHNVRPTRAHTRFGLASMRLLLDGSSLGLFAGVAFLLVYWLTTESVAARMLVEHALSAIVLIRGLSILAKFLLSPRAQGLRLFEMPSNVASALYRILLGLGGFALTAGLAARLLHRLGLSESHYTMCLVVIGSLVFLGLIALTWYVRAPVASAIGGGPLSSLDDSHKNVNLLAHTWHVLACAYLLLTGALWSANILIGRPMEAAAALSSLLIILLIPVIDRAAHALLDWIINRHVPYDEADEAPHQTHFTMALLRGLQIVLVGAALLALAEAWGHGVFSALRTEFGRTVLRALFDIGIILVLGYLGWDLFKHFISRWLPEEEEGPALPSGGDGGGAGGSRAQTLLPLLRTFVLVVLVVMVTMLILDQLGVNIGPLVAGAGVIGIAIGFGSQKLVQDVLSGVFFLLDDAFRMGEYIEINDLMGTVEKISIRSMQLRHHRGPLQTVPFSEIRYVRNNSRDWYIMKLEFRVPYDTNVERLRKLIKTLGQELLEDEQLGPSFIEPLKCQGVNRMEHTAMVIRVKFTAVPGEQWVLRREVYRLVQELLRREGIRFARPVVSVQVEGDESPQNKMPLAAAGAAAAQLLEDTADAEDDAAKAR